MAEREQYTVEVKVDDTKARMVIDRLSMSMMRLRQLGDFMVGTGGGGATTGAAAAGRAPGTAPGPATGGDAFGMYPGGGVPPGPTQPGQPPQPSYGRRMGRGMAMWGAGVGSIGGIARGYAAEQSSIGYSMAGISGGVSAITGGAQSILGMAGPVGQALSPVVGVLGSIAGGIFSYLQAGIQAMQSQAGPIAAYNKQLGQAGAGGMSMHRLIGKNDYKNAIRRAAYARANAMIAQYPVPGHLDKDTYRVNLVEQIKNSADAETLALEGGAGAKQTPFGFSMEETASSMLQYSKALGFYPDQGKHPEPFRYMLATAGLGAVGRFRGTTAHGYGGTNIGVRGDRDRQLAGVLMQAVSMGLRHTKVDEYLNTISSAVESAGKAGMTTDLQNIAFLSRGAQAATAGYGGIGAARFASGVMGGITGARQQVFQPFQQAFQSFALARAAKLGGPGIMGLAEGFNAITEAPTGLLDFWNSLPKSLRPIFASSFGLNPEMASAIGEDPLGKYAPEALSSKYTSQAYRGMDLARKQSRTSAVAASAAAGSMDGLMRRQLDKLTDLVRTGAATASWMERMYQDFAVYTGITTPEELKKRRAAADKVFGTHRPATTKTKKQDQN